MARTKPDPVKPVPVTERSRDNTGVGGRRERVRYREERSGTDIVVISADPPNPFVTPPEATYTHDDLPGQEFDSFDDLLAALRRGGR